VAGLVCDEAGQPLAGVRVRWQGQPEYVLSDSAGQFQLPGRGLRITAALPGFFIAGTTPGPGPVRLSLRPLPQEDHPEYAWVDPTPAAGQGERCGHCHKAIYDEWVHSSHARAASNPRFLNLYDGSDSLGRPDRGWNLLRDYPDGAGVCAACHAPTVPFEHPGLDDIRRVEGVAALGVHCDFCHKIESARVDRVGLDHGRYAYDLLRPAQGQLFFGPLDDVDRGEDAWSPLYKDSRYCAPCHEGVVFGVPVYTTYSEWLDSPARRAGKQCQDCHMAPTGTLTNLAPGHGGLDRDPRTLSSHRLPGATAEMLRRAVHVRVRAASHVDEARLEVWVEAGDVGHRVPTGFVERRLVMLLEIRDEAGRRLSPIAGPRVPSDMGWGEDQPGLLFAKVLEDHDGRANVPFWMPCRVREDTRLVPGEPRTAEWRLPASAASVRIRLVYYRFSPVLASSKGWPEEPLTILDQRLDLATAKEVRWSGP
jgi:hypothetical protein